MTSAEPVERPDGREPDTSPRVVPPAAGIYGLIVAASVIAAVGSQLPTLPLMIAVFGTVLVYWLAEEYAVWSSTPAPVSCPAGPELGRRSKQSGPS